MHQLRETHWLVATMIRAYIKSCPGKGLVYKKYGHVSILGDFDSGYAGDLGGSLLLAILLLLEEIW